MDYTDFDPMELLAVLHSFKTVSEKVDQWNAPTDIIDMVEGADGKFAPNGLMKGKTHG